MNCDSNQLDWLAINTLRALCIDMIQKANSGHPGLPLGAAPMAGVLWNRHLNHAPSHPSWPDRDRFVLSAGHGSSMLYSLLHHTGYPLTMDDLKQFRQWGSLTPGHPESHLTAGVEATTGPLGQGFTNAVGMAIAERLLAARFNRPGREIVNHFTYTLLGDGCIMEGVAMEAASLAGHLRLGKLIALYDANDVTLDGPARLAFTEDVAGRFQAQGWQVLKVADGDHDLAAIDVALGAARRCSDQPSLIIVKTTIGFGSTKAGTSAAHGAPFGPEGVAHVKRTLGLDPDRHFEVPAAVAEFFGRARGRGAELVARWQERFDLWAAENPDLAREWELMWQGKLPEGWDQGLPTWPIGAKVATRTAGGKALNAIAATVPWLVGGDADLSSSTKTAITGGGDFDGTTGQGRNLRYGVREHAMAAIANGIAYHGGLRSYVSTFFVFADYMRPAIRLAAMNHLPVIYLFTHDSVAVGEDGPTHQPVEQLASLRAMPGLKVIRPADANETAQAWRLAMATTDGPVALVLTRQDVPVLPRVSPETFAGGAFVVAGGGRSAKALLLATGSEVEVALQAHGELTALGIPTRVLSMPCLELAATLPAERREELLPADVPVRVSLEAGVTFGWERWVGSRGRALGIDRYGASAPAPVVMEKLGMSAARVVAAVRELLGY